MYGKQGHLVTLVDRNSRFLLAKKIALRTKTQTTKAVVEMLKAQPGHTLTLDNGVEFADHKLRWSQIPNAILSSETTGDIVWDTTSGLRCRIEKT